MGEPRVQRAGQGRAVCAGPQDTSLLCSAAHRRLFPSLSAWFAQLMPGTVCHPPCTHAAVLLLRAGVRGSRSTHPAALTAFPLLSPGIAGNEPLADFYTFCCFVKPSPRVAFTKCAAPRPSCACEEDETKGRGSIGLLLHLDDFKLSAKPVLFLCPSPHCRHRFRARSSPVEKQGMETSPLCERVKSAPPFPYFGGHPGWQALHSRSEGSCTCSYKGMNHRTSDLKFT